MRPDEHKQKKNTLYKKKHGIPSKKQDKDDKITDKKQRKADRDTSSKYHKKDKTNDVSEKYASFKPKGSAQSSESDDDVAISGTAGQKAFKRRDLVSNWQKYDLPEESQPELRGQDFAELLSQTGDALAQFRFQEESEWEATEEAEDRPDYLTIHCADLARAMASLPMDQRLQLDPNLFDKETKQLIKEEAETNLSLFLNGGATAENDDDNVVNTDIDSIEASQLAAVDENGAGDDIIENTSDPAIVIEAVKSVCDDDDELMDILGDSTTSASNDKDTLNVKSKLETDEPTSVHHKANSDEELDFLLGLSSKTQTTHNKEPSSDKLDLEKSNTQIEESLLAVPNGNQKNYTNADKNVGSETKETSESQKIDKTSNLEDWLDDILDD